MSIRKPFFKLSHAEQEKYLAELAVVIAYHRHQNLLPDASEDDALAYATKNWHRYHEQALTFAAVLEVDEERKPRGEGPPCPSVRVSSPA